MATPAKVVKLDDESVVSEKCAITDDQNKVSKNSTSSCDINKSSFDDKDIVGSISIDPPARNLNTFKLEKVLNNNTLRKSICLKGKFENIEGDAIIILAQAPFEEEVLKGSYFSKGSPRITFENECYGNLKFFPISELNGIDVTVIHPATEKHIKKYSSDNLYLLNETPDIYNEIVLPQLKEQFSLQWIYNILDHKAETERIVYEDPDPELGFVLLPDLKWGGQVNSLYLLAICNKRSIKSIRDLNSEHLPLLRNIYHKGIEAISKKYGLVHSQLRVYLHYQPSFYHLHVHFTYLRHEGPGILVERAHLLSSVISNIELLPDYYQKATISYVVKESDVLFEKLEAEKVLKKVVTVE